MAVFALHSNAVVELLVHFCSCSHCLCFCVWSLFINLFHVVLSSHAIILLWKRELVAFSFFFFLYWHVVDSVLFLFISLQCRELVCGL